MKFNELETHFSAARMQRYLQACNGDRDKAVSLYYLNLELSLALFAQISCFEVVLRNRIDFSYSSKWAAGGLLHL